MKSSVAEDAGEQLETAGGTPGLSEGKNFGEAKLCWAIETDAFITKQALVPTRQAWSR